MPDATPVLAFPAIRTEAPTHDDARAPQWTVRRFPTVGSDAVILVGFDGESYPLHVHQCKVWADVERIERFIQSCLDDERAKRPSRPSVLPAPLNLVR